jgi:hypothetical protein
MRDRNMVTGLLTLKIRVDMASSNRSCEKKGSSHEKDRPASGVLGMAVGRRLGRRRIRRLTKLQVVMSRNARRFGGRFCICRSQLEADSTLAVNKG